MLSYACLDCCPLQDDISSLAVCIQDLKLLVLVQKRLVLMLSVDIQKAGSCRLHLAYRTGFAVDLVDAPAVHQSYVSEGSVRPPVLTPRLPESFLCTR